MIKGIGVKNGRPTLMIGLSKENCKRLVDGKPIEFAVNEIPGLYDAMLQIKLMDAYVVILGGDTEETIMSDIKREMLSTEPKS
jgi:hypothetical protein